MRTVATFLSAAVAMGVLLASGCATRNTTGATSGQAVESTLIKSVTYDDITEELTIIFQSGDVYLYKDVPPSTHKGLMKARSQGKYYHTRIKDKYEGTKK